MDAFIEYTIPHKGLLNGLHNYHFDVNRSFFDQFEYSLIKESDIHIDVELDKRMDMMILSFDISGTFKGTCDRCLVEIDIPIYGEKSLIIKYSEEELDEEEEIAYISPLLNEINIAKYVYEFVILSLPLSNIRDCDEEENKYCDTAVLDRLHVDEDDQDDDNDSDSPWGALNNINFEP